MRLPFGNGTGYLEEPTAAMTTRRPCPPAPGPLEDYAQRFDASGTPVGGEFRVPTDITAGTQRAYGPGKVALAPNGDFVVTWYAAGRDGSGHARIPCADDRYPASHVFHAM